MTLKRGFKSAAEKSAQEIRTAVKAEARKRLDLDAVANHIGARIVSADTLVTIERLKEIERLQAFSFSACTFNIAGQAVIVVNPVRRADRRVSDTAHELAHIILGHELSEVQQLNGIPFLTCRPDQEEEATAFGGTLLLPRSLLLSSAKRGESYEDIAKRFGVTLEMARYRWNTTGVAQQTRARSG